MKQTNTLTLYVTQQGAFNEPQIQREVEKPLFANCDILEEMIQREMNQKKKFKNQSSVVSISESALTNHHLLKNVHHLIF
jgi:hypothetical protein